MKKALALATVCLGAMLASCSKDPPPKPDDGPKKTTPVPSDMVFNDFVPNMGGAGIVGVKGADGGLEAGADLGTASGGDAAGGAGGPSEADAANKLRVTEPGAEPRVARRYTFVPNKTEKRVITMRQSVAREGAPPQDAPAIAVTIEITAKAVKPAGARMELKVLGVDIPEAPPAQKAQIAAQLAPVKGLSGQFDLSKQGEVGEIDFKADDKMQSQAAELVLQAVQQAMELLAPAFPDEPVGVGAKWERTVDRRERGMSQTSKHTFTLKEATADGGVVVAETDLAVPKTPIQQRGLPPGTTQEVKGKGSYTYNYKLAGIATKVEGETSITQTLEVTDGKAKQSQSTIIKMKNALDTK